MKSVAIEDLLNIAEYEKVRDKFRKDIIAHKARRRIQLGPDISLTFEDRQTIIFQIQEMMRAERMVHDHIIQEEIDIYNTLLPGKNELSATLFIEIVAEDDIKTKLKNFLGLTDGNSIWLEVGDERFFAIFEEGRSEEDKISSVHYVRFPLADNTLEILENDNIPAKFCVSHGDYQYEADLTEDNREALAGDIVLQ